MGPALGAQCHVPRCGFGSVDCGLGSESTRCHSSRMLLKGKVNRVQNFHGSSPALVPAFCLPLAE